MTTEIDQNQIDQMLAAHDDEFAGTEASARDQPVPDGKFPARVERMEITVSKTSNKPMLKWQLKIESGPHAGRVLFRNNMLETRENFAWLKGDLSVCGVTIGKLSELRGALPQLLDLVLQVTVKNKTGSNGLPSQSVYLDKKLQAGTAAPASAQATGVPAGTPAPAPVASGNADIPF